jgi:hypothetical protein
MTTRKDRAIEAREAAIRLALAANVAYLKKLTRSQAVNLMFDAYLVAAFLLGDRQQG